MLITINVNNNYCFNSTSLAKGSDNSVHMVLILLTILFSQLILK